MRTYSFSSSLERNTVASHLHNFMEKENDFWVLKAENKDQIQYTRSFFIPPLPDWVHFIVGCISGFPRWVTPDIRKSLQVKVPQKCNDTCIIYLTNISGKTGTAFSCTVGTTAYGKGFRRYLAVFDKELQKDPAAWKVSVWDDRRTLAYTILTPCILSIPLIVSIIALIFINTQ